MYLNDAEGRKMRMRDLAASVILSRSGLTRLADRLEREGLIRRESCDDDARAARTAANVAQVQLDAAEQLDKQTPTYYGSAWVALGRVMLTSDLLDACP